MLKVINLNKSTEWFRAEMYLYKAGLRNLDNELIREGPRLYETIIVIGHFVIAKRIR